MTIFLPNILASLPRKNDGLRFSLNSHVPKSEVTYG
jgi:hypothetical protein